MTDVDQELQSALVCAHQCETEKRFADALSGYDVVLARQPDNWDVVRMKAGCLRAMHRFRDAIDVLRPALSHQPHIALGHIQMATSLQDLGDDGLAGYHYERALECAPTLREADWNLSLWKIAHGDRRSDWWRDGWEGYERGKGMVGRPRNHHTDEWRGEYLGPSKRLYIKFEQGLGDTIMFARFLPWAKWASGAHIILEVQEPLVPLLCGLNVAEVVPPRQGLAFNCAFDAHVSIMSLVSLSGAIPDTLKLNYDLGLSLKRENTEWLDDLISSTGTKLLPRRARVGICHKGSPGHQNDWNRSIEWETFRMAIDGADAEFQSLSPGAATEGVTPLPDGSFADTAALMAGLDLVITVDTCVAHIAGMLGLTTWMLTPCNPDFRWFYGRDDSPWYPTMRLFRQTAPLEWTPVLKRINAELIHGRN